MTCSKSIFPFVLMMAASGASAAQGGGFIVPLQIPTIQQAIDDPATVAGNEIVVSPGTDNEVITFGSKAIMLRSTAPLNPVAVVGLPPEDLRLPLQPHSEARPVPSSTEATAAERRSSPSAAAQVGGGDGDTCGSTTPTLVPVPGSVTIFGDSTGTTGPDLCVTSDPTFGNIWWTSFEITKCADVILDLCGTSPVLSPSWIFLAQCDDDGVGCSDFVISDFSDFKTCGDGNVTLGFFQLPPGTYYYPLLIDPALEGPFQVNISTTQVQCLGACCIPVAGTCTDDVEVVDCSADGQEFTFLGRCCELECRDPAGPEYDSFCVTLLSRVSIEDFATFAGTPGNPRVGNEVWGYTSPSGREYAIMGFTTGTGYVDVTDPANPVILEFINDGVNSIWRDMAIFGELAYVVAGSGDLTLMIVDLADIDAGNVRVAKTTDLGLGLTDSHNVYINAASATLYLPLSNLNSGNGLTALSLTDPLNPVLVGTWTDTDPFVRCHDVQVISYTDGPNAGKEIAFCFAESHGLKIVDVTDKAAMVTLSTLTYPGVEYCHQGWVSDDGQYVIFGDELDEYFGVVAQMRTLVADVSVLTAPTLAGTFEFDTCNIDHNQMVRGNLVFQANYSTGLHVLDFSSPPTLTQVAHFDTRPEDNVTDFLGAWGVFTDYASEIVVLSDRQRGLFVFAIGDPDDMVDTDGDGVPDGCDPCPDDNPDDTDGDGVCDSDDICPGFDDALDSDGDGVPDGCDICHGDNATGDSDGDGVCDSDDICPGGDDNVDENGNGVPDACDIESPTLAPPPHDILKNRYISIDTRGTIEINVGKEFDFRLTLTSTLVNGQQGNGPWWAGPPDAACL